MTWLRARANEAGQEGLNRSNNGWEGGGWQVATARQGRAGEGRREAKGMSLLADELL